ncbi:hypothetical protein BE17_38185 [Sorangium cellulosum]|uniref:DUF4276 family protein n=1 Tax=Sorangium cellulosum TaxID=56 RepID=A0A150S9P3_SORCE|nr:hypothetical protein BE17_38185 [Sorangium cellulosum]
MVLCEDKQSRTLLYRYLKHERGFERVQVLPLPAGEGCGSQYVRENYAREVRSQRDKSIATVLIVHVDADNHTVEHRHRELENALRDKGVAPRGRDEPIALVVPRWETETWLHHYLGRAGVVETERYPKCKGWEAEAAEPTVVALVALVDGRDAAPAELPALAVTAEELRRLP